MKIVLLLLVVVAALVVVIATRPATYRVERSLDVAAPAGTIFPLIEDLHAWSQWSPWEKRDPAMTRTYDGPAGGVGASYAWSGNKAVGKGRMSITESQQPSHVGLRLEFLEPFASVEDNAFDLQPSRPDSTRVTWSMVGSNTFMGKAFSLVMNMDKMIGKDFEEGLGNLKRVAEAGNPVAPAPAVY